MEWSRSGVVKGLVWLGKGSSLVVKKGNSVGGIGRVRQWEGAGLTTEMGEFCVEKGRFRDGIL